MKDLGVIIPDWCAGGFRRSSRGTQLEPNTSGIVDVMPNALARERIANALAASEENSAPSGGGSSSVMREGLIIFRLDNGAEHIIILATQARLLGLSMDANTLIIQGPEESFFVVVDRVKLGRNEKPAPIKKGGPDAALLPAQISGLNLKIAV